MALERFLSHGKEIPLVVVLAMTLGCGGTYDATVSGVVTLDGSPLSRGQVMYYPVSSGSPGIGRIDQQGNYTVTTGLEKGLPSGQYEVTVVANEPPKQSQGERGGPPPAGKLITPAWYKTRQHSGLNFTVEQGANEIDLPLTSEPPDSWAAPGRNRRR